MGLELVGGRQGQAEGPGEGSAGAPLPAADAGKKLAEQVAEAERSLAGARQRLQALVERASELRRRLRAGSGTGSQT
ncbi:MAG: hypothetical protein ABJA82_10450 [Myxococcales bacterium]